MIEKPPRRTDINIQEIILNYQNGIPIKDISIKHNISLWLLYKILKNNGINKKTNQSGLDINNLDKNLIISLYNKGLSATKISKQLKCSHTLILNFLEQNGINKTPKNQLIRKYKSINEHYFDIIDNEEKSYFLGLMFADGNVRFQAASGDARINLQERDKNILDRFSYSVFGEILLKYTKCVPPLQNYYTFSIHNKYICKQLEKLGCVPKKSLILEWPKWLNDAGLQKHFIRGYFDGDGCITFNKNTKCYKFSIISTLDFVKGADNCINNILPIHFTYETRSNKITTTISVSGNRQIEQLLDWLYSDATIYLERKYAKYKELKSWLNNIDSRINGPNHHINQYF